MTKQTYLNELRSQLKANNVVDIDEILAEYDEHFIRKTADGYTEEEIAAKLGHPKEIAAQFVSVDVKKEKKSAHKAITATGLVFADIFVVSFFMLLFAWVIVLGAAAVASAFSGLCLLLKPVLPADIFSIPVMPYPGAVILAVSLVSLGILFAVVTLYSWALTIQMGRSYRRWHKNMLSDGKYPPLSIHPLLKDSMRRRLRSIVLIALVVFGVSFVVGYIVLALSAGALGFWHVWHWFE